MVNARATPIAQGHKHIAIINGPMTFKLSFERLAAYTEALRANDIPIRNEYICYGNFKEENARDLTVELIKNHPKVTAIFSTNNAISRGCLLAFDNCNISVPNDIAFLSYGDEFSFGLNNLNISVVSDPNFEIGKKAAELLLERMTQMKAPKTKPARIIFTPSIILRGSEQFPKNKIKP